MEAYQRADSLDSVTSKLYNGVALVGNGVADSFRTSKDYVVDSAKAFVKNPVKTSGEFLKNNLDALTAVYTGMVTSSLVAHIITNNVNLETWKEHGAAAGLGIAATACIGGIRMIINGRSKEKKSDVEENLVYRNMAYVIAGAVGLSNPIALPILYYGLCEQKEALYSDKEVAIVSPTFEDFDKLDDGLEKNNIPAKLTYPNIVNIRKKYLPAVKRLKLPFKAVPVEEAGKHVDMDYVREYGEKLIKGEIE